MCLPFNADDQAAPPVTSLDLLEAAKRACAAILATAKAVDAIAFQGAPGEHFGPRRSRDADDIRIRGEEMLIEFRAACVGACRGTAAPSFAGEFDLAAAYGQRLEANTAAAGRRTTLQTAMDRADMAEAACKRAALDRGDAISAALYGTTETAPCADLTREAERFDYGRSAAANASASHGAYERGFVSPAAA